MPCRASFFLTAGYARGSGLAQSFRAKGRTRGIAPDSTGLSTARHSLASHQAAKPLRHIDRRNRCGTSAREAAAAHRATKPLRHIGRCGDGKMTFVQSF